MCRCSINASIFIFFFWGGGSAYEKKTAHVTCLGGMPHKIYKLCINDVSHLKHVITINDMILTLIGSKSIFFNLPRDQFNFKNAYLLNFKISFQFNVFRIFYLCKKCWEILIIGIQIIRTHLWNSWFYFILK